MTPEEKQQFEDLQMQVTELQQIINAQKIQQISLPLDIASIKVIAQALQDSGYIIT